MPGYAILCAHHGDVRIIIQINGLILCNKKLVAQITFWHRVEKRRNKNYIFLVRSPDARLYTFNFT